MKINSEYVNGNRKEVLFHPEMEPDDPVIPITRRLKWTIRGNGRGKQRLLCFGDIATITSDMIPEGGSVIIEARYVL